MSCISFVIIRNIPKDFKFFKRDVEMNSLERMLPAINGGTPDRVPIAELAIDNSVIQKIMLGASFLDFYEGFDLDGFQVIYDVQYEDVRLDLKRDFFGVVRNFKAMHGFFPHYVKLHIT